MFNNCPGHYWSIDTYQPCFHEKVLTELSSANEVEIIKGFIDRKVKLVFDSFSESELYFCQRRLS